MLRNSEDAEKIGQENTKGSRRNGRSSRKAYLVGGFVLVVCGVLCVLGGLYASNLNHDVGKRNTPCPDAPLDLCEYSTEAKRAELPEFLSKVHESYYNFYPETYAWENYISDEGLTKNVQER